MTSPRPVAVPCRAMARIVFIGSGISGVVGGLLLARDGHQVTVLERDPAPPTDPAAAFDGWSPARRPAVPPHPHRAAAAARDPPVRAARGDRRPAGSRRPARQPHGSTCRSSMTGGFRPGDERYEQVTGRRPMVEATLAALLTQAPGVVVRRGVAVTGLLDRGRASGRRPARHRRRPRLRRAHRRRPRRRHDRPSLDAADDAGRDRRRAAARGGRSRTASPTSAARSGRADGIHAADVRATAAALRLAVVRHRAGRQRHVVRRLRVQRHRSAGCGGPPTSTCGPASCAPTRCWPTGPTPSRRPTSRRCPRRPTGAPAWSSTANRSSPASSRSVTPSPAPARCTGGA